MVNEGVYGPYEKEFIRKDGTLIPVLLNGFLFEKGGEKFIWSMIQDLTDQKKEQSEIKQIMAAINGAAIVASTDVNGKIIDVNKLFCDITGFSQQELIGQDHRLINSGTHPKIFFEEMWNTIKSGQVWRGEIRNKAKNGGFYWVQTVIVPILDLHQQIVKFMSIRFEITAQKEAQQKMIESEKMSSLGQMAAGMAHEINNPLAIIDGKASKISRMLNDKELIASEIIKEDIEKIQKNVSRVVKIVRGLKLFSRNAENDPFILYSLEEIINDSLELCRERYKARSIELIISPFPDIKIECRPTQISQVILNLVTNAYDAVSLLSQKWIEISVKDIGPNIAISIRDSGNGISSDISSKMMQPFYTTKEFGMGTGLGLSVSKGIIEAHQGTLYLNSSDKNTCFVIELPKLRLN